MKSMKSHEGKRRNRTESEGIRSQESSELREFIRPENEDDDGYDPYSDRPARREPLFEEDPWA